MLQEAKEHVAANQMDQAKSALVRMKSFFEDAEIDGAPYGMVMGIMNECEELLVKHFPEFGERVAIAPKTFWQRLLGK